MPKPVPRPCRICGEMFSPQIKHSVTLCPKDACRRADYRLKKGIVSPPPVIVDGRRRCNRCGETKSVDEFPKRNNRRSGVQSQCKSCCAAQLREYNASPEGRSVRYMREYGVDVVWFKDTLDRQGGCCACCGTPAPDDIFEMVLDHDHETGVARGILCRLCNVGIGSFRDDPDRLRAAAKYLRNNSKGGAR